MKYFKFIIYFTIFLGLNSCFIFKKKTDDKDIGVLIIDNERKTNNKGDINQKVKEKDTVIKKDVPEQKNTNQTIKPKDTKQVNTTTQNKNLNKLFPSIKKKEYNISLLLPLYAIQREKEATNKSQILKSKVAFEFYQGALLALAKLDNGNKKINVSVVDIKDMINQSQLEKLKDKDLIIGPLFDKNVKKVVDFAQNERINIVTPFVCNDNLVSKPYLFSPIITQENYIELVTQNISEKYKDYKIIIVDKSNENIDLFVKKLKEKGVSLGSPQRIIIKKNYKYYGVNYELADSNVLIMPIDDEDVVISLLTDLRKQNTKLDYEKKYNEEGEIVLRNKCVIFGKKSWLNIEGLDSEIMELYNVYFPSDTYINYENEETKKFVEKYRALFKTEPSKYAFYGYDNTYFFTNLMLKNGKYFQRDKQSINEKLLQTIFNFNIQNDENIYWKNKHFYLLKFKNNELVIEK